jgi:hypothetical protein
VRQEQAVRSSRLLPVRRYGVSRGRTRGNSFLVRVDNVVLRADFDQSKALGVPDSSMLETLATELTRELESRQPNR